MSARPCFLLAHGAGAPSSSAWMLAWRDRLATLGTAEAFDYPYMRAGRKAPDRLPVLIDAHRAALAGLRARAAGPVVLVGKSMGGRVGCHLAVDSEVAADIAGVVCLGYPLRSGGTGALRDEVLLALRKPILFVQGTRDPLGPLDKLAEVRAKMTAPSTLVIVEDGNHSLEVSAAARKAKGETQADSDARVLDAIARFTAAIASPH
jgi:predicted alpha/beta-hydrolase family hydrolase